MDDILRKISGLSGSLRDLHERNKAQLSELSERLSALDLDSNIYAASENVVLDVLGNGDRTYGFLSYSEGKFSIGYRTTLDDLDDHFNRIEEKSYNVASIDRADPVWLRAVSKGSVIQSLMEKLHRSLASRHKTANDSAEALDALLDAPSKAIIQEFTDRVNVLGFHQVAEAWAKAKSALHRDPAEALTQASSMLESLFKHILHDAGLELPSKQTMGPLFTAVIGDECLGFDQVNEGVRKSLKSLAPTLGTLRTHAGSAHGRSPSHVDLSPDEAAFAVNSAGLVATFVMRRYLQKRPPQE